MEINLLQPQEDFAIETFDEFEKRYLGFGKEIYLKLKEEVPEIFKQLSFFKRITYQTVDSYALCDGDTYSFAIQLDPLCEVIVLWNEQRHIEIGTWAEDEYYEAINFIRSVFMR